MDPVRAAADAALLASSAADGPSTPNQLVRRVLRTLKKRAITLSDVFHRASRGGEFVHRNALQRGLHECGVELDATKGEPRALFAALDWNRDGHLTYAEFKGGLSFAASSPSPSPARTAAARDAEAKTQAAPGPIDAAALARALAPGWASLLRESTAVELLGEEGKSTGGAMDFELLDIESSPSRSRGESAPRGRRSAEREELRERRASPAELAATEAFGRAFPTPSPPHSSASSPRAATSALLCERCGFMMDADRDRISKEAAALLRAGAPRMVDTNASPRGGSASQHIDQGWLADHAQQLRIAVGRMEQELARTNAESRRLKASLATVKGELLLYR